MKVIDTAPEQGPLYTLALFSSAYDEGALLGGGVVPYKTVRNIRFRFGTRAFFFVPKCPDRLCSISSLLFSGY